MEGTPRGGLREKSKPERDDPPVEALVVVLMDVEGCGGGGGRLKPRAKKGVDPFPPVWGSCDGVSPNGVDVLVAGEAPKLKV